MRDIELGPEAFHYLTENRDLVPDVWAGLLEIRDANQPIGTQRATLYILEVMNHWIYYRWVSPDLKRVAIIKPK